MTTTLTPAFGPAVTPIAWDSDAPRALNPLTVRLPDAHAGTAHRLVVADSSGAVRRVDGRGEVASLAPVWAELAPGFVRMNVEIEGDDGRRRNLGHGLRFFRATAFQDVEPVPEAVPWADAADAIYRVLMRRDYENQHRPDLPPFVWHGVVQAERGLVDDTAYPGLHYGYYLDFLMAYAEARPELAAQARDAAHLLIDVMAGFTTPPDHAWDRYPYSTISRGQMGGMHDRDGVIQPLKAAMWAISLIGFGRREGRDDAVASAAHIAAVLARHQNPSGGVPFRVDAKTGAVDPDGGESTSLIFAIDLWERVQEAGAGDFQDALDRAWGWLRAGPLADNRWISDYDDVPTSQNGADSQNLNNLDALATAAHLLRTGQDEHSLDLARRIIAWVEDGFVFYAPEHPVGFMSFPCPAVMEQATHYYPIDFHLAGFAQAQLALHARTGEVEPLEKGRAGCNALTHYRTRDGAPLTYAPDPDVGYGLNDHVWFGCIARAGSVLLDAERMVGTDDAPAGEVR